MSRHLIAYLVACMALACPTAYAAGNSNCTIGAPPAEAGDNEAHGQLLKVYPRASSVGSAYTGCQTIWARDGDRWKAILRTRFVRGAGVKLWTPEYTCDYASGRLKKRSSSECDDQAPTAALSMPAGCLAATGSIVRPECVLGTATPNPTFQRTALRPLN